MVRGRVKVAVTHNYEMKSRNCEILIHNCEINLRNIFSYVKPCFCKLMVLTLNLISGLMSCLQLNNLHKPIINHIRSTVTETAMSHVYCKQLFIYFFYICHFCYIFSSTVFFMYSILNTEIVSDSIPPVDDP